MKSREHASLPKISIPYNDATHVYLEDTATRDEPVVGRINNEYFDDVIRQNRVVASRSAATRTITKLLSAHGIVRPRSDRQHLDDSESTWTSVADISLLVNSRHRRGRIDSVQAIGGPDEQRSTGRVHCQSVQLGVQPETEYVVAGIVDCSGGSCGKQDGGNKKNFIHCFDVDKYFGKQNDNRELR